MTAPPRELLNKDVMGGCVDVEGVEEEEGGVIPLSESGGIKLLGGLGLLFSPIIPFLSSLFPPLPPPILLPAEEGEEEKIPGGAGVESASISLLIPSFVMSSEVG